MVDDISLAIRVDWWGAIGREGKKRNEKKRIRVILGFWNCPPIPPLTQRKHVLLNWGKMLSLGRGRFSVSQKISAQFMFLQVYKCVVFVLLSSLQVSDPLDQALKFLRPLQNLASNRIETHLLAYEVFIRRSTYIKTNTLWLVTFSPSHRRRTC